MKIKAFTLALSLSGFILGVTGQSLAAGSGSWSSNSNKDLKNAIELIEDEKYSDAQPLLQKAIKAEPDNADAYNMLGYSQRKMGNKDVALDYYTKALDLNPRHRGANEYLGQLYLELNNPDKAKERLAVLDKSCTFGCDEYTSLKEAIEAYEKTQ
ncbi:tetratricopeptide repeat protein [uncultured Kiloniella sp.]|uniref:tetratricopeptide repeat protein n=1 Tax=uncultured Kiloniella sp. TaxID=1133091 RepID=UPI00263871D2|nr:tetratricopeptide repeat protein [uncultured Kiloniella sp.]